MTDAGSVSGTQVAIPARLDFEIRQASIADRAARGAIRTGLSPGVRYLRFSPGAPPTSQAMLRILTGEAGCTDALLATENGAIIGHAMASDATGPGGSQQTEIGVVVADGRRGMGVGSALTRCLISHAQARGATVMVMEVLAENRQGITMITDHWRAAHRGQARAYLPHHPRPPPPAAPGGPA